MAFAVGVSGAADESRLHSILRGEVQGDVSASCLRRILRRARSAAEVECKAALTAWREPPSLFTREAEMRAAVRGLPAWASAEARSAAALWAEAHELIQLCETYDAQVVVALCEGRAVARAPLQAMLQHLHELAVKLHARLPQLRTARAALDALPPEKEGWDYLPVSLVEGPEAAKRQFKQLPKVVISAPEAKSCTAAARGWLCTTAVQIAFEVLDCGLELAEALARLSGLLPYEALGEACAPWDVVVEKPSPWLAVVEVIATGVTRCKLGLGKAAPASFGRLLKVPQLQIGYWSIRGLGAPARMMCAYAGVDYHDVQYEVRMSKSGKWTSSEWEDRALPALVQTNILSQLPYAINLTTGDVVAQSMSVSIYLARVLGLNGPNRRTQALNEQVMCFVHTMWMELRDLVYPVRQNHSREAFEASLSGHFQSLTGHYEKLDSWLQQRGTGYFVSWKPCAADFHVWEMLDQQEEMAHAVDVESPLTHFDLLTHFHAAMRRHWRLRDYFESNDARLPINNKNAFVSNAS